MWLFCWRVNWSSIASFFLRHQSKRICLTALSCSFACARIHIAAKLLKHALRLDNLVWQVIERTSKLKMGPKWWTGEMDQFFRILFLEQFPNSSFSSADQMVLWRNVLKVFSFSEHLWTFILKISKKLLKAVRYMYFAYIFWSNSSQNVRGNSQILDSTVNIIV